MIKFEDVSKVYNKMQIALDKASFRIEPNEFVSIVGTSGAGKTTLLKLLIAEEKPTTGNIFFDNIDIVNIKNRRLPKFRRRIGMIFQDFKLLPTKNVYENISFILEVIGKSEAEIADDVPQALNIVGLLDKIDSFPNELSGGEKQRLAIARAIVHRPDLIIADEPTGNLDPVNTWDIIQLLLKINELGTTVILATHDKEIINVLNRRVITLSKGQIIRDEKNGRFIL